MNSGGYIGIIVGIVVFIVLKSTCIVYLWRRKSSKKRSRLINSSTSTSSAANTAELLAYIEKWEIRCDDVKIIKRADGSDWELGSGAFGRVVKGLRAGVQEVAIKMLFQSDQKAQEAFLTEISILKFASRDRNVVQFYGVSIRQNGIWLITEHMEGGDLRRALTLDGAERVTWWNKGKQIACDMARGLAFLHSNKIIHRDLKSKNVLLTKEWEAKITDVGMARLMSDAYFTQDASIGTFSWAAPEVLLGEKCSEKVDCYSLGVTCWEIATGMMPIRGQMTAPGPEECPPALVQLISDLMKRDPRSRPSAAEAYRRMMACEPNASIVPLPEDLPDTATIPSGISKDGEGISWNTNLDSAEMPTMTNAPGRLLELARGASNNLDQLDNSYATLGSSRKGDLAEKRDAEEAAALMRLAQGASTILNEADGDQSAALQAQRNVFRQAALVEPLQLPALNKPRKDPRPEDSAEHDVPEGLSTAATKGATNEV